MSQEEVDIIQKLKELKACVVDACNAAFANRENFSDCAVNWADFSPYQVEWFINEEGETGYNVFIDEASPDNSDVIGFIRTYLDDRGWKEVSIYIEW